MFENICNSSDITANVYFKVPDVNYSIPLLKDLKI